MELAMTARNVYHAILIVALLVAYYYLGVTHGYVITENPLNLTNEELAMKAAEAVEQAPFIVNIICVAIVGVGASWYFGDSK